MLVLMSPDTETLIPAEHPARRIKKLSDECLAGPSHIIDEMYAKTGRPCRNAACGLRYLSVLRLGFLCVTTPLRAAARSVRLFRRSTRS